MALGAAQWRGWLNGRPYARWATLEPGCHDSQGKLPDGPGVLDQQLPSRALVIAGTSDAIR
jgi:hypothetical protein